jgi:hypothetical protein
MHLSTPLSTPKILSTPLSTHNFHQSASMEGLRKKLKYCAFPILKNILINIEILKY